MRFWKALIVGLLLAAQPAQTMLGLVCRDGDQHEADHCSIPPMANSPQVSAMSEGDPTGCRDMPACREPAPCPFSWGGDQVSSPDLLRASLAPVGTLHSVASERPPTPPPNG